MSLKNWEEKDNHLIRIYKLKDFQESLELVNKIGKLAEEANHHPDLLVSYGKLEVSLTSHDQGKITAKDYNLAQKINQLI
ncbi:MAG: 4a-hydroxytetrahydrobiopterin dehydratase [Candidatus Liptonbacteria bacterium CG11_big_fil_rev_8_21_14_0_20_35_14]|uniref:4a-hydroxytetrahydrobiopterin dehydratase n=1 Tax=Candidatus Liptonbacteria bacterium CG11_big_fil_rev_8_21_14_0_20_35_14 TaxID=1974634 RepID=A0A2H0N817_9BACT|nr:MAG: 4a-hydroxytetrahydrobiopterin dehydratase [Candidatus Liptonbacteria bacterium CG11_big_fil_rev_8_21_14_0_20_35_14]